MSADLALFELGVTAPPKPATPEQQLAQARLDTYRWLCQRGWTIFGDGTVHPAWVCPVCGSVQANDFLLSMNCHVEPRHLHPDGAGGWLLQPWSTAGCSSRNSNYLRWRGSIARGESWSPAWWESGSLPWAPTREAAEALGAA